MSPPQRIADTSSLLLFTAIDALDLLRPPSGRLIVPEAVWKEIVIGLAAGRPGPDVPSIGWMELRTATVDPRVLAWKNSKKLGDGELGTLSLALQMEPDAIAILDEKDARQAAADLDVPYTGMLGILIVAKEADRISDVRSYIDRLLLAGAWLAAKDIARALRLAGE
jgi:predicted nucleic acid-binding protein